MIPEEIELLAGILIKFATNNERQANEWAHRIVSELELNGYMILETDRNDEEIPF